MTAIQLFKDDKGEPRVTCESLNEALGYSQKGDMTQLILRHRPEMETYGFLLRAKEYSGARGRPRWVFQLNEQQAVLACILSHTPKAIEARRAVIETFAAWRNGTLRPYRRPTPEPVRLVESFSLTQRHDRRFIIRLETMRADVAKAVLEACLSPLLD
jgi:hypothetical protein